MARPVKYPWELLEPGQHFTIDNCNSRNVASIVSKANKRYAPERKFTSRKISDATVKVFRL